MISHQRFPGFEQTDKSHGSSSDLIPYLASSLERVIWDSDYLVYGIVDLLIPQDRILVWQ